MKIKSLLLLLVLGLMSAPVLADGKTKVNSEDHPEGIVAMEDAYSSKALTKQELRQQKKQDRKLLRAEKKQYRMEKRAAWVMKVMERKMAKSKKDIGSIDDPVDKWFWYWLIGWGAALLISILFWSLAGSGAGFYSGTWLIFGLLSTLLWIGGTVSLIIWLINKFG